MTTEERELAALVGIAHERRNEPDFAEAVAAILDWHDRRHIRWFEQRQRRLALLGRLLRETDCA